MFEAFVCIFFVASAFRYFSPSSFVFHYVCSALAQPFVSDLRRGNKAGVAYGRDGDDLPSPDRVAQTGWKAQPFQCQSYVDSWLSKSILPFYQPTKITHITVGLGTPAMHSGVGYVLDTPAMPGRELDVYIFSLFNENNKTGAEIEGNWGIFYPDMSAKNGLTDEACIFGGTGIKVYSDPSKNWDFFLAVKSSDPNGRTWCIASKKASRTDLQNALDWASGPGKADCSSIQPNQQCFEPNTLLSHASFAFNNYYQKNGATDASCSFRGNAIKVGQDPTKSILFQINSPVIIQLSFI
ncbi:Detected protein of confused Function [Hibiscus syriacus]|uniref:glucan endo-1,3-beta-D-glucosidase n=1 Tax=Hibiscus syriacus TaxID=106335 RepID=A0A6A3CLU2_HIBSY|nr:Detected protein of confused Function [Hibiscus syriacus]